MKEKLCVIFSIDKDEFKQTALRFKGGELRVTVCGQFTLVKRKKN